MIVDKKRIKDLLTGLSVFDGLDPETLDEIALTVSLRRVPTGETLIEQDSRAESLYLVASGRFRVARDGQAIATVGVGEPLGELSFFSGGRRTASVSALRDSEVLSLTREGFEAVARHHAALPQAILATVSARLAAVTAKAPVLSPMAGLVVSVGPVAGGEPLPELLVDGLLRSAEKMDHLNVHTADTAPVSAGPDALAEWFAPLERAGERHILLVRDPQAEPDWARFAKTAVTAGFGKAGPVRLCLRVAHQQDVPLACAFERGEPLCKRVWSGRDRSRVSGVNVEMIHVLCRSQQPINQQLGQRLTARNRPDRDHQARHRGQYGCLGRHGGEPCRDRGEYGLRQGRVMPGDGFEAFTGQAQDLAVPKRTDARGAASSGKEGQFPERFAHTHRGDCLPVARDAKPSAGNEVQRLRPAVLFDQGLAGRNASQTDGQRDLVQRFWIETVEHRQSRQQVLDTLFVNNHSYLRIWAKYFYQSTFPGKGGVCHVSGLLRDHAN